MDKGRITPTNDSGQKKPDILRAAFERNKPKIDRQARKESDHQKLENRLGKLQEELRKEYSQATRDAASLGNNKIQIFERDRDKLEKQHTITQKQLQAFENGDSNIEIFDVKAVKEKLQATQNVLDKTQSLVSKWRRNRDEIYQESFAGWSDLGKIEDKWPLAKKQAVLEEKREKLKILREHLGGLDENISRNQRDYWGYKDPPKLNGEDKFPRRKSKQR